jgi:hypothetical protein
MFVPRQVTCLRYQMYVYVGNDLSGLFSLPFTAIHVA